MCRNSEYCNAGVIIMNVVKQHAAILSGIMLNISVLNVVMLKVTMLVSMPIVVVCPHLEWHYTECDYA
jgi:hypothetical protein